MNLFKPKDFFIQYSHDRIKWFDYGKAADKPTNKYTESDGRKEYDKILKEWHSPYPAKYVRLCRQMLIIRSDNLTPVQFTKPEPEPPKLPPALGDLKKF